MVSVVGGSSERRRGAAGDAEFRRDPVGALAVVLLREKEKEEHHQMRQDKGERIDPKVEAGTHWVVDGKLKTAAVVADSGEEYRRTGGAVEGKNGTR